MRLLWSERLEQAAWFALQTKPQKMFAAVSWLELNGVEAWFPTRTVWSRNRFRPRQRLRREVPVAHGYVFARFEGVPRWDLLFNDNPGARYLSGVVCSGGKPAMLRDADLARMSQMPERIAFEEAQREEAMRVNPGDTVKVIGGLLDGWIVEVQAVKGGLASLFVPLLNASSVQVPVDELEKQLRN